MISKLVLFRESTEKIILSKNHLSIEERQLKNYVIHLKEFYSFLTVKSDDKHIKISIAEKNFSTAVQWIDEYLKNFKNDDLTFEYRYNRINEDNYSKKLSDFIKSIDKTKNHKDYYISGTEFIEQILVLSKEKKLIISSIEIDTHFDNGDVGIYKEIEVEEVHEIYDVLREDYLSVKIKVTISSLHDESKKNFATPCQKKESKTPNVVLKKNSDKRSLSDEEIEILKLRQNLNPNTYKDI